LDVVSSKAGFAVSVQESSSVVDAVIARLLVQASIIEAAQGSDSVTAAFLWNLINDFEAVDWQNVNTSEALDWQNVNTAQTTSWQQIPTT
jgi:hypothetical protein